MIAIGQELLLETKKHLLISEDSPWGNIEVWQEGTVRSLYIQNNIATQSQLDMARKEKLLPQYCRAMMSFLLFKSNPKSVLLFGLGGGSIVHFLYHWFPRLKITAVDINDKVINIAKAFFDVSETPQVSVQVADASTYINQTKQHNIDVILVDIHNGECLPAFLYNPDFIAQCFRALSAKGILVINVLVNTNEELLNLMRALRQSFSGISLCMTLDNQKNILLFAFKSPDKLLNINANEYQRKYGIEFDQFVNKIIKVDAKINPEKPFS